MQQPGDHYRFRYYRRCGYPFAPPRDVISVRNIWPEGSYTYKDLVRLKPGAYDLTFTDKNEDGMIRHWWLYWEDKEKVSENGELKILDAEMNEIMNLGYDFAEKRTLQFFVGEPE